MPLWPVLALGVLLPSGWQYLRSRHETDRYRRGALIEQPPARLWARKRSGVVGTSQLTLGGVPIAVLDETKHFKLLGTTGTGKSTAIRELLTGALARGDRAVIADPDGGYRAQFARPYRGDVILNPFDPAALRWDPFQELRCAYDAELLASALIPGCADAAAQEWRSYGRTFITALLRRCHAERRRDVAELWRLVAVASPEELRPLLLGTPAQPFLEAENARMFGSIRAVAASAMASLEHTQLQRAASFSIREWVRTGRGSLFIPYLATQIAALRGAVAAWLRLAIFEAMSQPEGRDQRLWVVVDELDALGAIDGLEDALARLRKFGGRCVLGFQSIAQVSTTYGAGSQTIVENCGNTLILRCSGSEQGGTSQFASRLIGEREVLRRQTSRGRDGEGWISLRASRRSLQISEHYQSESAVLASEIEQLPDLCGYLKTASVRSWRRVRLQRPV